MKNYLPALLLLLMACGPGHEVQVVKDHHGKVRAEVGRYKGHKEGPVRFLHADGSVQTTGRYANDSRHGAWTTTSPEGDTLAIVSYRYGRKDGWQAYWANNGRLLRVERFRKGEPDGPLYRFYSDGTPRQLSHYDNGRPQGRHIEWFKVDSTSVALLSGQFQDGERSGRWTWFYGNGRPNRQGHYAAGKQVGVWRYWNAEGTRTQTRDFGQP